jgi:flagellar basal body-associated protein FliL
MPGPASGPPAGYAPVPQLAPPEGPGAPAKKSRRGLIILLVVAAVLILLAGAGAVLTLTIDANSSGSFAINSCVKRDGSTAKKVDCSDPNAFVITNKVDKQERCPDSNQPFVVLERSGAKDEILCLRPASQK